MAGLYESVSGGLSTGYQMRSAIDERRENALDAKQRELTGGLIRQSITGTPEEKFSADKQLAAIDPDLFKKVQENMQYLQPPELKKIQATNKYISLGASNLRASPNDQLANNIFQAVKAYQQMGMPEVAEKLIPMIPEAQTHPEDVKKQLEFYEKFSYDVDKEIELNLAGRADIEKDFTKAENVRASSSIKELDNRASNLLTSSKQLTALKGTIDAGGDTARSAIGSAITLFARMQSPGTVSDADQASVAGATTIEQGVFALADKMFEKGASKEEVEKFKSNMRRAIDPKNPQYFNSNEFFKMVQDVAGADANTIVTQFADARDRAKRSNMGSKEFNTNFGEQSRMIQSMLPYLSDEDLEKAIEILGK